MTASWPSDAIRQYQIGSALCEQGNFAAARLALMQALALAPTMASAHYALARVSDALGDLNGALNHIEQAGALGLAHPDVHNNHGLLLVKKQQWSEAAAAFRRCLESDRSHFRAWFNLGSLLRAQKRPDEARSALQECLRIAPNCVEAHVELGLLAHEQGYQAEALAHFQEAVTIQPGRPDLLCHLGDALRRLGRLEEAATAYRQVLERDSDYADAHAGLGNVLQLQNDFGTAFDSYRVALRLAPANVVIQNNLGIALHRSGNLSEAVATFRGALQLQSDFAEVHLDLAMSLLAQGNFADGWREYEWRWRCPGVPVPQFRQPRWDGSPLAGRTILLVAEQGLGDMIQFVRFAQALKGRSATVLLQCQPELSRLLASCPFLDGVFARESPLPSFDVYAPLLSLPGLLGITLDTIPVPVPYLHPEPALVHRWQLRLRGDARLRVGINWQGGNAVRNSPHRATKLRQFAPLARIEGVELVSLQKGFGTEQLRERDDTLRVTVLDDDPEASQRDFADTSAIMAALDVIISTDTSVAHLAGALGRPTWLILPADAEWRWLRGRADSPWYPTMRLFRQPRHGDWDTAFSEVAQALKSRTLGRDAVPTPQKWG